MGGLEAWRKFISAWQKYELVLLDLELTPYQINASQKSIMECKQAHTAVIELVFKLLANKAPV